MSLGKLGYYLLSIDFNLILLLALWLPSPNAAERKRPTLVFQVLLTLFPTVDAMEFDVFDDLSLPTMANIIHR